MKWALGNRSNSAVIGLLHVAVATLARPKHRGFTLSHHPFAQAVFHASDFESNAYWYTASQEKPSHRLKVTPATESCSAITRRPRRFGYPGAENALNVMLETEPRPGSALKLDPTLCLEQLLLD